MTTQKNIRCIVSFIVPIKDYVEWLQWVRNSFLTDLFYENDRLIAIPYEIKLAEVHSLDTWTEKQKKISHGTAVEFCLNEEDYPAIHQRYLCMIQKQRYQYPNSKTHFYSSSDHFMLQGQGSSELTDLTTLFPQQEVLGAKF